MSQKKSPRDVLVPQVAEIDEQVRGLGSAQDDGTVLLTEEQVEELGAANAEAMQSNMAQAQVAGKKKNAQPNVSWGTQDATLLYDQVVRLWPPSTLQIHVVRLSGGNPIAIFVRGEPRTGQELYEAVLTQAHRQSEESEYKITIKDKQNGLYKGIGRIYLPDTRGDPNIPMNGPQGRPAPLSPFASFGAPASMSQPVMPPMPPPAMPQPAPSALHTDPVIAQLLAHMQSLTQHVVQMSQKPAAPAFQPAAPAPPPPPPVAAPPAMGVQPPPPEGATFFMPGVGWVQRAQSPRPEPAPMSAIDQMRASLDTVGQMMSTIEQAKKAVPGLGQVPKVAQPPLPEPDPIKTVEVGDYKIIQSTEDGSFRPVETVVANMDKIFKFVSDETQKYQRANAEREARMAAAAARPAQPAALPEGAVP